MEPTRIWNENLIPGVEKSHHRHEDGFVGPHGHDDLSCWVIREAIVLLQFSCDSFSQFRKTIIGGVVNLSLIQSLLGRFLDVGRGVKIGSADLKVYDILPGRRAPVDLFKYLPYSGKGNGLHTVSRLHHGILLSFIHRAKIKFYV